MPRLLQLSRISRGRRGRRGGTLRRRRNQGSLFHQRSNQHSQLLNNAADSVSGESNGSDKDVALCLDIKVVNWVFVLTTGKEETSKYSPIVCCLHADFDRGF